MTETIEFQQIDAGDYVATSPELNRKYTIVRAQTGSPKWYLSEYSNSTDERMRNTHTLTKAHAMVIAQDWVNGTIRERDHGIRSDRARRTIIARSTKLITDQLDHMGSHDYDYYDRPGSNSRGSWRVFTSDVLRLLGMIRDHQARTVFADLDVTILLNTLQLIDSDTKELTVQARINDVTLTIIEPINDLVVLIEPEAPVLTPAQIVAELRAQVTELRDFDFIVDRSMTIREKPIGSIKLDAIRKIVDLLS